MAQSMSLGFQQKQSLKQSQRLMMSPQMQQAIHLLQMPILELSSTVDAELEQNPVLEYAEEVDSEDTEMESLQLETSEEDCDQDMAAEKEVTIDDRDFEILKHLDEEYRDHFAESAGYQIKRTSDEDKQKTFIESSICAETTLFNHLMNQAQETFDTPDERKMAELIIGNLDERGFLTVPLDEISILNNVELEALKEVLEEIQTFEPYGIAAADVRESLLIQMRCLGKKKHLAYKIIDKHYDDLLHNRIPLIEKGLHCSASEIRESIDHEIAKLDLHPGTWHSSQLVQHITADVVMRQEGETLKLDIADDVLPPLRINSRYMRMLEDESLPQETKDYVRQKIMSGKWLLKNIHQRNDTILRIAESLSVRQKAFFMNGDGQLHPLTMKTVAEELGIHESTVARAVANKYIDCPRGLLPLRSFFTNSYVTDQGEDISSKTVKEVLLELTEKEDKKKPLSDEAISKKIKEKGINCARRTVAKYRLELNIGTASQRKRYS